MVGVIEQSPNMSEMRANPPASSPSTLLMEPCYDNTQEEVQTSRDIPVIVETHPEPAEEQQVSFSLGAYVCLSWPGWFEVGEQLLSAKIHSLDCYSR